MSWTIRFFLFISLSFTLSSCQTTGMALEDVDASVSDLRKAFVIAFGEPREISENGRVLTSRYHDQKGKFEESVSKAKVRRFTRVEIFGDRRPYNVKVDVLVQQRQADQTYEDLDPDERLETQMSERLKKALHQSRENRNAIDDMRAF